MALEVTVERVERDQILELRARVLSDVGARVAALSGDLSPATRHWAAWLDDAVVGCVSVMRLRGWALRGMAVSEEHQRKGVGQRLLQAVHAEVDGPMWCNARLQAVPFYSQLGWVQVGPIFSMGNQMPHQRMTWTNIGAAVAD
ncbi:MAG: GNAT family N-acetyltransferase [Myxococcota bacterium]|nr:GNAT family N-acetyltransferase [Myxococcota bacterium]